ncbi:DUF2911 domain-containing protein [Chryseobacterium taklimakanense]|uniref:DUF2911 domain-containing protein n=1 Tax=Chryseobacterium taklimakanense TaxID=536441 RepID=UPI001EF6F024|nr:DUF2911 domain-containing protein [Chryseobacterium taklimakanense]MCG7280884.1 DUF2911 domain-containing protein [Chryseobacterium taklimakanense]
MKRLLITALFAISVSAYSQWTLPAASPRATVEQQFSMSKITVDYGRPGVKGRKVFGDLVPYGKVWRAGANSSTKIEFRQSINFGGVVVPAGKYGLYILPNEKDWKIILNSDSQSWGTAYDASKDLYSVVVPVQKMADRQEFFEIALQPLDDNAIDLVFKWDNVKAAVPMKTGNPENVAKIVDKLKEIRELERNAAAKK